MLLRSFSGVVLLQPFSQFREDVAALFDYLREMGRAGIGDHADSFSAFGEQNVEFAALESGNARVGFAVKDEQGRGDLVHMHHGGKLKQRSGIFFLQAGVEVNLPNVTGGDEAEPVGDTGAFDGGAIAVRLSDGPGSHEAAGAPAKDGEAVGVGPALGDGVIGGAVDVVVGAVAEVLVDGGEEVRAVAGGTAVFGLEDDVAEAGDGAREGIEGELVVGLWAAVRQDEEFVLLAFNVAGGKGGDAFKGDSLFAFPVNDAGITEVDGGELGVAFVGDLAEVVPVRDGNVAGVLRIADVQGDLFAFCYIRGADGQAGHYAVGPLEDGGETTVAELIDFGADAAIDEDQDAASDIAGERGGRGIEAGSAVFG